MGLWFCKVWQNHKSSRSTPAFHEDIKACHVTLQVTKPENGKDVSLRLVVHSKNNVAMMLSVGISVQAMRHNGTPGANIKNEVVEKRLQRGRGETATGGCLNAEISVCLNTRSRESSSKIFLSL